jgi:hypothetical protein
LPSVSDYNASSHVTTLSLWWNMDQLEAVMLVHVLGQELVKTLGPDQGRKVQSCKPASSVQEASAMRNNTCSSPMCQKTIVPGDERSIRLRNRLPAVMVDGLFHCS